MKIKFQNGAQLEKTIFDLLFTFLVTRESYKNSFSTYFTPIMECSHTYTYFAYPIDFFALPILKKKYEFIRYGFSLV